MDNTRLTIEGYRVENGLDDEVDFDSFLARTCIDSTAPALCTEGCEVEPDGTCEHGNPSILIAMEII